MAICRKKEDKKAEKGQVCQRFKNKYKCLEQFVESVRNMSWTQLAAREREREKKEKGKRSKEKRQEQEVKHLVQNMCGLLNRVPDT